MSEPTNKKLYNQVLKEAKEKYKRFPSLYASAYISKTYQQRGGKYTTSKDNVKSKQKQWFDEEWIQIIPYIKDNKIIKCGSQNKSTKACRPLKRINKTTPPTIGEIIDKFGKDKVLKLAQMKNANMKGRLDWINGKFNK